MKFSVTIPFLTNMFDNGLREMKNGKGRMDRGRNISDLSISFIDTW